MARSEAMNQATTFIVALMVGLIASTVSAQNTQESEASLQQWTVSLSELSAPGKNPAKIKGAGASQEKLFAKVSKTKTHLAIYLSDGKQKFGSPLIHIRNGENIYMRPRLNLSVSLETAKAVTKKAPLKVIAFSHLKDKYEIDLVANPDTGQVGVVISKKQLNLKRLGILIERP